jgi:hypothetical protein
LDKEVLLAGLKDPESRVREAAAEAAAQWVSDPEVTGWLQEARDHDRSEMIREIAREALASA